MGRLNFITVPYGPSGNEGADALIRNKRFRNNPPIASAKNLEVTVNENCPSDNILLLTLITVK